MYHIPRCPFIFKHGLGRQLAVARGALILGLAFFTRLGKLPRLVCNKFTVAYLFKIIG